MQKSGFRVVVFPEGKAEMKEFSLSKSKLFFLCSTLLVVVSIIIAFSVSIISKFVYGRNVNNLKNEKVVLNDRLYDLITETDNLKKEISNLSQRDDQLRLYAGIPRLDKDIKDVGVGGTPSIVRDLNGFFRNEENLTEEVIDKLDEFERKITLLRKSYEETAINLEKQKEFRRYFPAIRPVKGGKTTDRFGFRIHPVTKKDDNHKGVDISIEKGTPVYATADGVVTFCKSNGTYGNFILIDHNKDKYGFETGYGHLSKFLVKKDQKVKRGDIIGEVGDTGTATAPHLHYEVRFNSDKINPLEFYYDPKVLR